MLTCYTAGDVPWREFRVSYGGSTDPYMSEIPTWMSEQYVVHYRDPRDVVASMVANPDFKNEIAFAPFIECDSNQGRLIKDFMSAEWAWRQVVRNHSNSFVCFSRYDIT